ncbi:IclR family transcriptional regulator [Natronoglomus mannanivorans]|uniref:IclR family transcriptional regulator n=1 Tax=Natronoglomus mannanivorans TaxID=2979990 RepID=A0AAP2YZM2_9EURY|nr:IclR family transcriptional regulator [Halobacteria archaeon AArc-xg1-1]
MGPPKHHVKSVSKTFEILEAMEQSGELGVTELSRRTGIAKSSVYKYLDTLRHLGFVTKSETEGTYSLSLRFFQFGQRIVNRHDVYRIARPELEALAEKTGEVASLVVEEDGDAVSLYRTRGRDCSRGTVEDGDRIPIHSCAAGKALLSYRPPEEVEAVLAAADVDVDRQTLFTELETARDQRLVVDRDARDVVDYSAGMLEGHRHTVGQNRTDDGLRSIAVPIRDEQDYAIAAIEVIGTDRSLNARRLESDVAPLLVSAGKSIEIELSNR